VGNATSPLELDTKGIALPLCALTVQLTTYSYSIRVPYHHIPLLLYLKIHIPISKYISSYLLLLYFCAEVSAQASSFVILFFLVSLVTNLLIVQSFRFGNFRQHFFRRIFSHYVCVCAFQERKIVSSVRSQGKQTRFVREQFMYIYVYIHHREKMCFALRTNLGTKVENLTFSDFHCTTWS
jgi:hypothetical protein